MIIVGDDIHKFRLLTLRKGLEIEIKGMKLSRGRSCYTIIKREFGFKGNKQKVLTQFNKILAKLGV
tara:strand:+ start:2231 stop:2428 length:198 start_codon:yes stop_codon:yes gene_type:complete